MEAVEEEYKDLSFYVTPGKIVQIQDENQEILDLDEVFPHQDRIRIALVKDNDDEFVKLVTGKHEKGSLKDIGLELSPSLLLRWALQYRSIKCVQAIVSGKTGLTIDLNSPLCPNSGLYKGLAPLHVVIGLSAPDFVELFLDAGARSDVPCQISESVFYMMLPIDQVLFQMGKWTDWTPNQSVYVLIFDLCNDQELIDYLKIISLLLHHSSTELAWEVFNRYAREGRATELAVLLYVDSVFGVGKFAILDSADYTALRLSFAEEVVKLSEEELDLAKSGDGKLAECINKKQEMISVLLLLDVFQRTNFHGIGADATVEKLAGKLQGARLDLNGEFKYCLKDLPARGVWMPDLHESLGVEKKLDYLPSFLQAQNLRSTMPVARMLDNEQRTALARSFNGKQGSTAVPNFSRLAMLGTHITVDGAVSRIRRTKGDRIATKMFLRTLMKIRRA